MTSTIPPHMPPGMDHEHWTCIPATETTLKHYVFTKPIEKMERDDRAYRVIRLENGLEAVLVSDSSADESAASLQVAVGYMSDPDDMPGLAHFCEHLLFMGTEQFPEENEYAEYLAKNGGGSNAGTTSTSTSYYFMVSPDALEGALARFSSFFHSPLFEPSCTLRELNAVDSEHKMNLQSDMRRLYQLEKSLSKPGHPWHKFGTGDKHTLTEAARQKVVASLPTSDELDADLVAEETRRRLIEWWSKEYCASRMSLALVGSESLDELTEYVIKYFSPILNRGQDPYTVFTDPRQGENDLWKMIFVKTIKDVREVNINFPIPYLAEDWSARSADFVAHFVTHEGPGSLHGYLKGRGWINLIRAEPQDDARGISTFNIYMQLTKDGFKHYEEVILACFKYLDLLRSSAFPQWIHNELKALVTMQLRFSEKMPAECFAESIASSLAWPTPRECIIIGSLHLWEWNEQRVRNCLALLTPDKSQVFVLGKSLDEEINISGSWLSEKWYGTQYLVKDLFAKQVSCRNDISELHLPFPNEFIPEIFDCPEVPSLEPLQRPTLIKNTALSEVWHKKDDQFLIPKAHAFVFVQTPEANAGVRESVMTTLYTDLVDASLEEYSYDARLAEFSYSVSSDSLGLQFHVAGFNDKLDILLQRWLEKTRDLVIDPDQLEAMKENLTQDWENSLYDQPITLSDSYGKYLFDDGRHLLSDKIAAISDISVEDMRKHVGKLFSQVRYKILINGNIDENEATRIATFVEETLTDKPLDRDIAIFERSRILPKGCNYVLELPVPDPNELNSAVKYFCHVGNDADARLSTMTWLLVWILNEPVFNVLRTQEQLGYDIYCNGWQGTERIGLCISVQSERDPKYLETRIEAFLTRMGEMLECMDEATFEEYKRSLSKTWTDKLKNLAEETACFWAQILLGTLDFEDNKKKSAILQGVTKADIISLFKTRVDPSSAERSKLSVHMRAQAKSDSDAEDQPEDEVELGNSVIYIEDLKAFKSTLLLSGPPEPVVEFLDAPAVNNSEHPEAKSDTEQSIM